MHSLKLRVEGTRFLPGFALGLSEGTALVHITFSGAEIFDEAAEVRVRSQATTFYPKEDLYLFFGIEQSDWPGAFLVDRSIDDEQSPAHRLGRWIVALTVALQRWAHESAFRGRVVHVGIGELHLAIPWRGESLFADALDLALQVVHLWVQPEPSSAALTELHEHVREKVQSYHSSGLTFGWLRFLQAAVARDIPFDVRPGYLQLGWGVNAEYLNSTFTGNTSHIAHYTAKNKAATSFLLSEAGMPVPPMRVVATAEQATEVAAELGWPVVVKPLNQDDGLGVVTGIRTEEHLHSAFDAAANYSPGNVIVEKHVDGDPYRLLVIHGRLVAAVRRVPSGVTGDGEHSIAELIVLANTHPRPPFIEPISVDDKALEFLSRQDLNPESVPERGQWVCFGLTRRSIGGSVEDVSDVHPDNRALAERAARLVRLDIAGVDLMTTDLSRPWWEVDGFVGEVNSQPALMPHWLAQPDRDINGEVLDLLLAGRSTRIPTAALTGAGGAEGAAMSLYRIWSTAGRLTGVCTTETLRIGDMVVSTRDCSGFYGTRKILTDPGVEAAVLELPAEKLREFGHGGDRYDVVAVLRADRNVAELQADLLERARHAIVVNADDPLCMAMRSRTSAPRHILVTALSSSVSSLCQDGSEVMYFEHVSDRQWMTLATGGLRMRLMPLEGDDVPRLMNAMFAAALAWAQGIETEIIQTALSSSA